MAVDKHENKVRIGSRVRVLYLDPKITEFLPSEEIEDINSMINDVLDVYEIRGDLVRVEKNWDRGKGRTESHILTLGPSDIELVLY